MIMIINRSVLGFCSFVLRTRAGTRGHRSKRFTPIYRRLSKCCNLVNVAHTTEKRIRKTSFKSIHRLIEIIKWSSSIIAQH